MSWFLTFLVFIPKISGLCTIIRTFWICILHFLLLVLSLSVFSSYSLRALCLIFLVGQILYRYSFSFHFFSECIYYLHLKDGFTRSLQFSACTIMKISCHRLPACKVSAESTVKQIGSRFFSCCLKNLVCIFYLLILNMYVLG